MKVGYVYIMSNKQNGTLYVGITSNLLKRVWEHKEEFLEGFTQKYQLKNLLYYKIFDDIKLAIAREKQLKAGSRKKKLDLINGMNPQWNDLYESIV